jgi:hypothetical protein
VSLEDNPLFTAVGREITRKVIQEALDSFWEDPVRLKLVATGGRIQRKPYPKLTAKSAAALAGSVEHVIHDDFVFADFAGMEIRLMSNPIYANPGPRSPDFYTWLTARDQNIPISAVTQEMRRWTKQFCWSHTYGSKPAKWYADALKEYEASFH